MNVLISAIAQPSGISGVQRHALNLVRCLLQLPEVQRVHLLLGEWQREMENAVKLRSDRLVCHYTSTPRASLRRNLWLHSNLPRYAREVGADVVHLSYPMPFSKAGMPCPVVVTLHDLYPYEIPGNFGFPQVLANRFILRRCLQAADAIACVSRSTQSQLRLFGFSAPYRRSVVIPNCVEPLRGEPTPPADFGWEGEPFLLCVAQHRRNKNLAFLLKLFACLRAGDRIPAATRLIIVGIRGPETPRLNKLIEQYGLSYSVLFTEGLSDGELRWCYEQCAALVVPSMTEGFGLPVAEGRLAGCSVICSDIPAFQELKGPGCTLVPLDKYAPAFFCRAILRAFEARHPPAEALSHLRSESIAHMLRTLYADVSSSSRSAHPRTTSLTKARCPAQEHSAI